MMQKIGKWLRGIKTRRLLITHRIKDGDDRLFFERKHSCPACHENLDQKELEAALYVCPSCDHHFRITPWERIKFLADGGVFHEFSADLESANPLSFPNYEDKLDSSIKKSGLKEAIVTGICRIEGKETVLAIMAFEFLGGSMGSVVGEKVTRAMLTAAEKHIPIIIFTASGGARMHEGIFSLMQMAKTSGAAALLNQLGVPFFIVLTDPTTGGVTASYAMLGDVILAEPGALVGFAGRRVVDGTIKEKLPDNFQTAEFQLEKGFVDAIVPRREMRKTLAYLIDTHTVQARGWK
ncbi:MAG TPA: acetyl-CoA carboxylase carboxyltransferase subunit beta [Spirochaetia bacterium]|nr:acetyl-CoA carboxylase carboxyltransferase subunit beta [Spirochaetia bacterium]